MNMSLQVELSQHNDIYIYFETVSYIAQAVAKDDLELLAF